MQQNCYFKNILNNVIINCAVHLITANHAMQVVHKMFSVSQYTQFSSPNLSKRTVQLMAVTQTQETDIISSVV